MMLSHSMFAKFKPVQNTIHVHLKGRPTTKDSFASFLSTCLACFNRNKQEPFLFIFDLREIEWSVWDIQYLDQLTGFMHDLRASRQEYPEVYNRLQKCYIATEETYIFWLMRLVCAIQKPIASVYFVPTPQRALDVETLLKHGYPINDHTAPDLSTCFSI